MSVKEKLSLSCNKTLKALFNEFPGLGIQEAKRIDESIKKDLSKSPSCNEIIKKNLDEAIKIRDDEFESKCSRLADSYQKNSWRNSSDDEARCLVAYLITVSSFIFCIYIKEEKCLYFWSFIISLILVTVGFLIIKYRLFRTFVAAFNKATPITTLITCVAFCLCKALSDNACLLLTVLLASLVLTVMLTIIIIKR